MNKKVEEINKFINNIIEDKTPLFQGVDLEEDSSVADIIIFLMERKDYKPSGEITKKRLREKILNTHLKNSFNQERTDKKNNFLSFTFLKPFVLAIAALFLLFSYSYEKISNPSKVQFDKNVINSIHRIYYENSEAFLPETLINSFGSRDFWIESRMLVLKLTLN